MNIKYKISVLNSTIETADNMIDMGINELGLTESDWGIQDQRQRKAAAIKELAEIKAELSKEGIFVV